jgi:hypothetical protein
MYDLIGDIHGCAQTLKALLDKLGYTHDGTCYRHPERQVIFLGDFIDRGPFQRESVEIVMAMTQNGAALAVMGNHEFNAIAYHTADPEHPGKFLRAHNDNNLKQHKAFLEAYQHDKHGKQEVIDWFYTLPLWLDLGALRVVHACWAPQAIALLQPRLAQKKYMTPDLLVRASRKKTKEYDAVELLLKGKEIKLPDEGYLHDKEGHKRHHIRIKWWEKEGTYQSLSIGVETEIPEDSVDVDHLITYNHMAPPVFVGHYWLHGTPEPLADNVACLDYSVAKPGGKLVAYHWDGEQKLADNKFISVTRLES